MRGILAPLALLLVIPALAQESANYKLNEHTFNAGGNPSDGVVLTSTSYRITLDALGDSVAGRNMSSVSYRMDGSFVSSYPPPGEVLGLSFTDHQTLVWHHERSVGDYNLYRDLMSDLDGLDYGSCEQQDIPLNTTTDGILPSSGDGYFYLVTAENRLDEEGTLGTKSTGAERPNTDPCP